ncbi:MAG: glycosyltransferase, partial [Planctomycetaceae bacterium]|nr:glycosyltransferase [Planctomycetaceae bacterium]
MSHELPFVSCLCPTYRRPQLLRESIACFEAQDYPVDRRELIILDDAGELENQTGNGWQIISIPRRFRSLPEKFNAVAALASGEILVVWEDDDIYLSHHISSHVAAM